MANSRTVKLAGPFYKEEAFIDPFYKVLSVSNTLIVRPGELYTEGAVKVILGRTKDRVNPLAVNIVAPKEDDRLYSEGVKPGHILTSLSGLDNRL